MSAVMSIAVLGIDLAKRVVQLHGVDAHGRAVVSKRVSRAKLADTVAQLAPDLPRIIGPRSMLVDHGWWPKARASG